MLCRRDEFAAPGDRSSVPQMLLLALAAAAAVGPVARSAPQLHPARATHPARVSLRSGRPVGDASSATGADQSPSIRSLVGFAVPLLGIGLASPLLGLVDSAVVGRCAGSLQLAALAPAVSSTLNPVHAKPWTLSPSA